MIEAKQGEQVKVKSNDFEYQGIIMPSSDSQIIMLKLSNGYNIGIARKKIKKIIKVGKSTKLNQFPQMKTSHNKKLPTITIISTGGTITSRVDYKTGAVRALSKQSELLANIPELAKIVNLKLINPFNIMSEDMSPKEWQKIAEITARELKNSDGVIVTHGTDTLHFTSAALSFMLKNLSKPVALVGGQRSSDRGSFDGAQNLICAVHYCCSDIAETAVVMHANSADDYCYAIRGVKIRKMHTSRRDAFRPINDLPLAKIHPNGKIEILNKKYKKRTNKATILSNKFEPKIALIKAFPGADPEIINFYIKNKYKGLIIEGTGLGHVPKNWIKAIKQAIKNGIFVGITSQCIYGRTHSHVYSALVALANAGAIHLSDMLPETAYVKLGWALAQTKNKSKLKELMLKNITGEINNRIPENSFLY